MGSLCQKISKAYFKWYFISRRLFICSYILKNVSFTRYLLVVIPMLLVGMFGIDLILSILIKKEE